MKKLFIIFFSVCTFYFLVGCNSTSTVERIIINGPDYIWVDDYTEFTAYIYPERAVHSVTWSLENNNIDARISSDGIFKSPLAGKVTIIATVGYVRETYVITVNWAVATNISIEDRAGFVDQKLVLDAKVYPTNTNQESEVIFETIENSIGASITDNKIVSSMPGTVTLRARLGHLESNIASINFSYNPEVGIIVTTAEQLNGIRDNLNGTFQLGANIDLSSISNWTPIGPIFQGTLIGNNFTISNLQIDTTHSNGTGLFSNIGTNGTVRDLNLANVNVIGGVAGALVGISSGTISNVHVLSGKIGRSVSNEIGGIVGRKVGLRITNSSNAATVQGHQDIGGISGLASMGTTLIHLNNLANNGTITGFTNIGGIFGRITAGGWTMNWGTQDTVNFTSLYNNNKVTGSGDNVGGLFGRLHTNLSSTPSNMHRPIRISLSENNADITGNNFVGGYVGNGLNTGNSGNNRNASGVLLFQLKNASTIIGRNNVGGLAGSAGAVSGLNAGNILATGENVGGLVGYLILGNWHLSVGGSNTGIVQGTTRVGGISGWASMSISQINISNFVNNGTVSGTNEVGGIFGRITAGGFGTNGNRESANFTNLVNNGKVIGTGNSVGGLIGRAWTNATQDIFGNNPNVPYVGAGTNGHRVFRIFDSANNAQVSGNNQVGGFVGFASVQVFLGNPYNINSVGLDGITATGGTTSHEFIR